MTATTTIWIFIIDTSGSMSTCDYPPTRLVAACEALTEFVKERRRAAPCDKVAIIAFSDNASVKQDLISVESQSAVVSALRRIKVDGGTNFASGLREAETLLKRRLNPHRGLLSRVFGTDESESGENNATTTRIVFCSDGHDYGSRNPVAIARKMKATGIVVECIGIGGCPKDVDEKRLRAMASVGPDGRVFYRFIGDKQKLIQEFRRKGAIQIR